MDNTSNTPGKKNSKTTIGFVLLNDANFDWPRFRHNLKEDWNITFEDEVKDGAVVFRADDMTVACSLLPNPVPNGEAEASAKNNLLWKDASEAVAKHAAHVLVAVMDTEDPKEQDPVSAGMLLCKVASSMLKLKNTIGIYRNPTVFERSFYIEVAEGLKKGQMPIPIMLHFGMYVNKESLLCGFTYGLRALGKQEIEVIGSHAQPQELFSFLLSISEYILSEDIELKDGETIGFTEEQRLPITVSKSVSYDDGDTVKIGFKT